MKNILKDRWLWYNGRGIVFIRDGKTYFTGRVPKSIIARFAALAANAGNN